MGAITGYIYLNNRTKFEVSGVDNGGLTFKLGATTTYAKSINILAVWKLINNNINYYIIIMHKNGDR